MAGTYRPTIIRFYDAQGRQVRKGTPGARRVREKSKTFWGRVPDANGKVRSVVLCDDADAAESMLAAMKERAKRIKRGDIDPFEDHRERPLGEHVEHFQSFLESKGNTAAHVTLTVQRLSAVVDGCKFKKLSDLNAGRVSGWLADRRKPKTDKEGEIIGGLSVASSNHYLVAVKSFGHWLVKDRRGPENPFAHLSRMNARVDVRHERRALTQKELGGLIGAVEKSDETFRGLDGSTRASAETPEMQKTPQKHEVSTEFSEARPAGLEPVTSGSTVRRGRVLTLRSRNELRSGVHAVLPTVTPTHRKTNAAKWSAARF